MRRLLLIFGAVALTLLFFRQLAFTDLILARGDTYVYFYPYWAARDAALMQGQLPLWSPDIFMGVPLLSNPQLGTFYPPNWLTIPFAPPDAVRISILLHVTWATLGAYFMGRRILGLQLAPAIVAGVLFGLSGFLGAHVEQINQLQGLAWMPWIFTMYKMARDYPLRFTPILAVVLALQLLSGHTQTLFITSVGLMIYTLINVIADIRAVSFLTTEEDWRLVLTGRFLRRVLTLVIAFVFVIPLTLPQLFGALELTGMSNRGGGFSQQQAMAFSLNPVLAARGLLPSYDAQVFGEYVAFLGVFGLGLVLLGAFSQDRRRVTWVVLALLGIFLALGAFNPLYYPLASLPGFNFFRVPARWLALFVLAAAMLAGLGMEFLLNAKKPPHWSTLGLIFVILGGLAASTVLADQASIEIDGPAFPTLITWIGWGAAFILFANAVLIRQFSPARWLVVAIPIVVIGELWLASLVQPFNDLVDPNVYEDRRMTAYQLEAYGDTTAPSIGRVLSISRGLFDLGDKSALETRFTNLGMSERAKRYGFTATKSNELIVPNVSMQWDLMSVDGFGGGVLPTGLYTQFTSLLLPEGIPRTIDGRLREVLAEPQCRGACIPEQRWLNLMDVRYLVLDKVYDPWHDGVAYDVGLAFDLIPEEPVVLEGIPDFIGDELRVLYTGDTAPEISAALTANEFDVLSVVESQELPDGTQLASLSLSEPGSPTALRIETEDASTLLALTLVDTRTEDFMQYPFGAWSRVLSSDVKLYENTQWHPRAFVVHDIQQVPDTWAGTEDALDLMRDPAFDPFTKVIVSGDEAQLPEPELTAISDATVTAYSDTRVEVQVSARAPGMLVLSDAYFPGWYARVGAESADVYRANVMFRAVQVPAGESLVVFEFSFPWLDWTLIVSLVSWLLLGWAVLQLATRRRTNSPKS